MRVKRIPDQMMLIQNPIVEEVKDRGLPEHSLSFESDVVESDEFLILLGDKIQFVGRKEALKLYLRTAARSYTDG